MNLSEEPARNLALSPDIEVAIVLGTEMSRQIVLALYVVAMAVLIVGVDFVFFRNRVWERLTVNIGIVLVFAAVYWRFLKRP